VSPEENKKANGKFRFVLFCKVSGTVKGVLCTVLPVLLNLTVLSRQTEKICPIP
jgi:hypothetical protein